MLLFDYWNKYINEQINIMVWNVWWMSVRSPSGKVKLTDFRLNWSCDICWESCPSVHDWIQSMFQSTEYTHTSQKNSRLLNEMNISYVKRWKDIGVEQRLMICTGHNISADHTWWTPVVWRFARGLKHLCPQNLLIHLKSQFNHTTNLLNK